MDESAVELPSDPGSLFPAPPVELSKESIAAESNTIMDDDDEEAKNAISMDQATCGLQLVEDSQHLCPKDESAGKVHSEPGSLLCVPPPELSKESIVTELKTIMDDADAKNILSMDKSAYGWQLVEELQRRDSVAEPSEETTSPNVKIVLDVDEVESATLNGQVTNTVHLVEEVHQRDDETGHSFPPPELSNNEIDLNANSISEHDEVEIVTSNGQATSLVQLVEDLPQQDNKSVFIIPSVEVCKKLVVAELKPVSKDDEVENIVLTDGSNNGLQLVEDLHQRENETKFSDEIVVVDMKPILNNEETGNTGQATKDVHLVGDLCLREDETELSKNSVLVAETELEVGTVSSKKELIVKEEIVAEEVDCKARKHEKVNQKLILNKKRTEIAEELEFLKAQSDQKLKKIDEIVKQEQVIDTEIAHMESCCNENKCKHAKFIDLYKLIAESQLPLRTHREIKLLIDKEDKAAQMFLTKALKLQIQIGNRAELKLTLQEERTELEKLVEVLRVQMDQKLKDADEVKKHEEAVDSETTHIVPQHSGTTLVYTRSSRKRKTHDSHSAEKEVSAPEVESKRMTLNTVDSSQECVHDGMVTDP